MVEALLESDNLVVFVFNFIEYHFQTRENNKVDELMERIHQLENNEATILKESNELKEQNELLEFRIIELEESTTDKVN